MPWDIATNVLAPALIIPLVGTWLFATWIRRQTMKPCDKIGAWDVFMKGISALTAIVAGALAVVQYIDRTTTETNRYNSEKEQESKRYNNEQLSALARLEDDRKRYTEGVRTDRERYHATWDREISERREDLAFRTRELNLSLYKTSNGAIDKAALYHEAVDIASTLATAESPESDDAKIAWKRFERLYWGQLALVEQSQVTYGMQQFRQTYLRWSAHEFKSPPSVTPSELEELSKQVPSFGSSVKPGMINPVFTEDVKLRTSGPKVAEGQPATGPLAASAGSPNRLQVLALFLAHACRHELGSR